MNPGAVISREAILRRLFWKLFMRGRALSRRRGKEGKATQSGLTRTLVVYGIIGIWLCFFAFQADTLTFATATHGITLFMVVFQMVMTAGSVLFNKEEAEILLHRPVMPRELLRAKVFVLCAMCALLGGALNLPAMIAGIWLKDAQWWFPIAHAFSLLLMIVFSAGALVVVYQSCLRWFGRERLDGMMTTMQTLLAILMVAGSQSFRFLGHINLAHMSHRWWLAALPPVWFASLDALISSKHWQPFLLTPALFGVAATCAVGWLGFHRLASAYGEGLMLLNEAGPVAVERKQRAKRLRRLVKIPPLSWWVRDPIEKESFLLAAAYLVRDRETKLRLYPSLAQMIVMPLVFLFAGGNGKAGGVEIGFAGMYLGWLPLTVMQMLEFSEHWRASEVFQFTPGGRWQPLFHGARKAGLVLLGLPALLTLTAIVLLFKRFDSRLLLLLPSVVVIPIWSLVPGITEAWIPLSKPFDAKTQGRRGCLLMLIVMGVSSILSYVAWFSLERGWFHWFMLAEIACGAGIFFAMCAFMRRLQG